jgi:leucyl-tRNA synthetase
MPEKPYDHNQIELKWHARWQDATFYQAEENSSRPKYYVLEMLPYPSGTLHIGHIRNYAIGDALARYKWMRGFNVLHPMGWDAFGLPAENAAIANQRHPRDWTLQNIAAMKKTHRRFGFSFDWDREVSTCEPEYYRWNDFLKEGLLTGDYAIKSVQPAKKRPAWIGQDSMRHTMPPESDGKGVVWGWMNLDDYKVVLIGTSRMAG